MNYQIPYSQNITFEHIDGYVVPKPDNIIFGITFMAAESKILFEGLYPQLFVIDTPPAGYWKIYPKTDGWYMKNSAGTETKFVTGSGFNRDLVTIVNADSPYSAGNEFTILCDCSSGAITINLPSAATETEKVYNIKKIDSTADLVTISPNGSDEVEFESDAIIGQWGTCLTIQNDGTDWYII